MKLPRLPSLAIYPTRLAIGLAAAGAPLSLLVGLLRPGLWMVACGWIALVFGMLLLDAALGADRRALKLEVGAPGWLAMAGEAEALIEARFTRGAGPVHAQASLEANARIQVEPAQRPLRFHGRETGTRFTLKPVRRGQGALERLWLRWRGPFGLVWKQHVEVLAQAVPILPNIAAVKAEAIRLFARDAQIGLKTQLERGDGTEFHALRDFQPGMNLRAIDWKQSARHGALLAKEYRTERNHPVILALDTGRLMSEPLEGQPRIDRAINAALLLAYVSLKIGDRVGLFAFDAKPNLTSGAVSGTAAFPLIQHLAARIDYSTEETNFTLGLTALAGGLERRSLVVVFTDFVDSTSAELMVENVARLMRRHLVLFVAFRDEELEQLARAEPLAPADVSRAVIAGDLLRERRVVMERLRRLGVQIVDAPADRLGPALLDRYMELKRRELL